MCDELVSDHVLIAKKFKSIQFQSSQRRDCTRDSVDEKSLSYALFRKKRRKMNSDSTGYTVLLYITKIASVMMWERKCCLTLGLMDPFLRMHDCKEHCIICMSADWDQRRRFESPRAQKFFIMFHDKILLYLINRYINYGTILLIT